MSATDESETQTLSVENVVSLHAITKAELDQAIATAKAWPRDVKATLKEAARLATLSEEVADECIYALPRTDRKSGEVKTIEGPSVRMAEILASTWGNCRAGARIIEEGRDYVVAQGVFHDLQSNAAITYEVRRGISTSTGRRYSADMIGVTSNAACAIALRNVVLKGIPKALWNSVYRAARECVAGDASTLPNARAKMLAFVQKFGMTQPQLLAFLEKETVDQINGDDIARVRGLCSAIRDGETTAEAAFNLAPKPAAADAPAAASAVDRAKDLLTKPAPAAPEQKPPETAPAEEPKKKPAAKPGPRTAPEKKPAAPDTVKGPKEPPDRIYGEQSPEDLAEQKLQEAEAAAEQDAAKRGLRGAKSQAIAQSEDADDVDVAEEEKLSEIPYDPPADTGKVKPAAELSPEMKARYEADNPKEPSAGAGPLYASKDKGELIKQIKEVQADKGIATFRAHRLIKAKMGIQVTTFQVMTVPQLQAALELLQNAEEGG